MRYIVLGSTGSVGRAILNALLERHQPDPGEVFPLGSDVSEGEQITCGEHVLSVWPAKDFDFQENDCVFSALPQDIAKVYVPKALDAGAFVIDKSAAYRDEAPLVVPEINGNLINRQTRLVASPNCVAIPAALALYPLHQAFGLERVVISSYQAVSGAGKKGLDALYREAKQVMMASAPTLDNTPFGEQIAFNVIPQIGSLNARGESDEEEKITTELQKILQMNGPVTATAVRVPTFIGHGMAIVADFTKSVEVAPAKEALNKLPGLREPRKLPSPMDAAGEDDVLWGRLRKTGEKSLALWVVADNLRKGAALNAVQIAEKLLEKTPKIF